MSERIRNVIPLGVNECTKPGKNQKPSKTRKSRREERRGKKAENPKRVADFRDGGLREGRAREHGKGLQPGNASKGAITASELEA